MNVKTRKAVFIWPRKNNIINYYLKSASRKQVTIKISDVTEIRSQVFSVEAKLGIHRPFWNMHFKPSQKQRQQFVENIQKFIERQEKWIKEWEESLMKEHHQLIKLISEGKFQE